MPVASLVRRTRRTLTATLVAGPVAALCLLPAALKAQGTASSKPTVAIMYFTNGALGKAEEYVPTHVQFRSFTFSLFSRDLF
jgi:hypothetical protein